MARGEQRGFGAVPRMTSTGCGSQEAKFARSGLVFSIRFPKACTFEPRGSNSVLSGAPENERVGALTPR